ncbi:HupE/UreJ family protein [Oceanimonas sp. CHS3-5]|uniref:HupE/UreJ family protein n=1 Tax=Oceanimonas sp. CHS3-5 TaxID=3068186 RepID=UPI00273D4044|nr:HupE/UreJ family protein [Oceanimonas sp. CHS3-5]MDP5291055.1 HupE/UreJ family protein [Oceanimonas sp. CHS3-5]
MNKTLTALLALAPVAAFAHPGHGENGLAAGLLHPLMGGDHLLAMLAVGMLAMAGKTQAGWRLPLAFVAAMVTGAMAGMAGVDLPAVEPMILASLVVLGGLLAVNMAGAGLGLVLLCALFGLFHGNAHGLEAPASGSAMIFMVGMMLATGLLHAAGWLAARYLHEALLRVFGLAVAGAGLLAAM